MDRSFPIVFLHKRRALLVTKLVCSAEELASESICVLLLFIFPSLPLSLPFFFISFSPTSGSVEAYPRGEEKEGEENGAVYK